MEVNCISALCQFFDFYFQHITFNDTFSVFLSGCSSLDIVNSNASAPSNLVIGSNLEVSCFSGYGNASTGVGEFVATCGEDLLWNLSADTACEGVFSSSCAFVVDFFRMCHCCCFSKGLKCLVLV